MDDTRQLYHSLLEYSGTETYSDVLLPWLNANPDEVIWIRDYGSRQGKPFPVAGADDLFRLYALSRVCETLLLGFQKSNADAGDWTGPVLSASEFERFVEAVGLTIVHPIRYSPFHHEIVELEVSKKSLGAPVVLSTHWPCVMLGTMMFVRAGATVMANEHQLAPGVADTSTIYWAYRRKNRPSNDLSMGWGSNSQWRTCFRRDYQVGGKYYFNVDGKNDLARVPNGAVDDQGLSKDERIELLVNRSFLITQKPHDDLYPYDDTFSIKAN
jgi:hypothetical protein